MLCCTKYCCSCAVLRRLLEFKQFQAPTRMFRQKWKRIKGCKCTRESANSPYTLQIILLFMSWLKMMYYIPHPNYLQREAILSKAFFSYRPKCSHTIFIEAGRITEATAVAHSFNWCIFITKRLHVSVLCTYKSNT